MTITTPVHSGIGETAANVFETIKDGGVWLGHQVSKGFGKCTELVKSAWNTVFPFIEDLAIRTVDFLRTAPGLGLLAGITSMGFCLAAHSARDNQWLSLALQISSITFAAGAGALLAYGYATGMNNPLI